MLPELLTATTNFHVFPLNYQSGTCRFCDRTYTDYVTYDKSRVARVCPYFGDIPRSQVLGLVNFVPSDLIARIMDGHRQLRNEMRGGAYAPRASDNWTSLANEFRFLVERLRGQQAAGLANDPIPSEMQPPMSLGEPVSAGEMADDVPLEPGVVNSGYAAGARRAQQRQQPSRSNRQSSRSAGSPAPLQPGQQRQVRPGDVADIVNDNLGATDLPTAPKNRQRRVKF